MDWQYWILLLLQVSALAFSKTTATLNDLKEKRLSFVQDTRCTYSYEVAVHVARGSKSTESDGFQVHALVDITSASRKDDGGSPSHLYKLDVREPRLRRVLYGRVLANYPVNEEFEGKLSKPFYFLQKEHGTIVDVLFPKSTESSEVAAFKKGIASAFQVNLRDAHKSTIYEVQECDDSGIFRAKYKIMSANDTHVHLHRTWTNLDYEQFADGTPVKGEHKVQSQHSAHVLLKDGKMDKVHRTSSAFVRPINGNPRAENFKDFRKQDIEMSTSGYSKLTLRLCFDPKQRRSKRSISENEHLKTIRSLTRDSLLFDGAEKIKWSEVGGEKQKTRPLYKVLSCFVDKSVREREIGYCTNELHHMIRNDKSIFRAIKRLIQNRNHQNLTSWAVYVAALTAHGKYEAQNALAHALKTDSPRSLTFEEYETLLLSIFFLPDGPLHSSIVNALFELTLEGEKSEDITSTAMLVLAGITERAKKAGYNVTLIDTVAEMIQRRYRNRSSLYHPESMEYESHLRDHIWAFGNLGHHSGLPVILEHIQHDNSGIRLAVISAMRKMSPKHTDQHLMRVLYQDEHSEVKAAVVNVFRDRHKNLSDSVVQGLEHALWYADKGDTLDSSIQEFLENHGNHTKAVYLRKKRDFIHRRRRAVVAALRPREYELGISKPWRMGVGGEWLGAETALEFANKLKLKVGIFGGKLQVSLDNFARVRAHILKFGFEIVNGKAAFMATASFKNDFPKDLIHNVADAGHDLIRQFDSISSVITEQIDMFRRKLAGYLPLNADELIYFVNAINDFLNDLAFALKAIKGTSKVISFAKDLGVGVKMWSSMIDKNTKIQHNLARLTGFDKVSKKFLTTFDNRLRILHGVSKYLPNDLPENFSIKNLLWTVRKIPAIQQTAKIQEYFMTLGSPVPEGFCLPLLFKFSLTFSYTLKNFEEVVLKVQRFSSNFLDTFLLLDSFQRTAKLPTLTLPVLKLHSPTFQTSGLNSGLGFDWKASLNYDLMLKSPNFQKFIALLGDIGVFFGPFTHLNVDLEKFFQNTLPERKLGLHYDFYGLYRVTYGNPSDLLQAFLSEITNILDFHVSNISAIDHMTAIFRELGPALTEFAEQNGEKTCQIRETAINFSHEFDDFEEKIEKEGIFTLKATKNTTQKVLLELLNLTIILDTSIKEIERNFNTDGKRFSQDSLHQLTGMLKDIQNLADDVVDFANGTSSKMSGACTKTAISYAYLIDEVRNVARQTVYDLTSVIGPVATNIKTVGTELKSAVSKAETWYEENVATRKGKISRISQITSDFLSIVNTKKGFLITVRDLASRLSEVLKNLRKFPQYASKARKTVDEVINFTENARSYKDAIEDLDVRKPFGSDFEQWLRTVCNTFKPIAVEKLDKVRSVDLAQEVIALFKEEVNMLVDKTLPKLRIIKRSIEEMQRNLQELSSMLSEVIVVLQDLKPFTKAFLPIMETARKLPDCQQMKQLFLQSTKPCVRKAISVGEFFMDQYKDLKNEIIVFNALVPEMWKNLRIQKCLKGGTCVSKAFIEQGKVIKHQINFIKDKLEEASEFTVLLSKCKHSVNNITDVLDAINLLIEQLRNFSLKDDIQRMKTVLLKITGRTSREEEEFTRSESEKSSIMDERGRIRRTADYIQKAKKMETEFQTFQENTFQALRSVYDDAIHNHVHALMNARSNLKLFHQFWEKTKNAKDVLKVLDAKTKSVFEFADKLQGMYDSYRKPTINLLADTEELSDVVKPQLGKYALEVTEAAGKANGFLEKVTNFLNQIQTRQTGLDPRIYKPWQDIPYCAEDICLRSIRRSSPQYLSDIFPLKFPHLDDLSSMEKSGRWLIPGLFDNYKMEGIAQLSKNEMILGMYGVASNKDKASLLVVASFDRGVKKIIELTKQGSPLSVKIGGVAIARDYVWINDNGKSEIISIKKSYIKSESSWPKPSQVDISKTVSVVGTTGSVSYDEQSNVLWVTSGKEGKSYGYKLSSNGDLTFSGLAPHRVIHIGRNAQGMTIVRQFGDEYACISRCALIAGFQCKLEFHHLNSGDYTGENTLARIVRTPSGLESVNTVDNEIIALAFSSATFNENENIELIGGDFEDRYFKIRLPILNTIFKINENCLYFTVKSNYVLRPRRLFPFGDMICGTKRKRSIIQERLDTDVYHSKLEDIHESSKRVPRNTADLDSCTTFFEGSFLRGHNTFFEYSITIPVFGIPVRLFAGAGGHYSVGYQGEVCLKRKIFKLGLIPGAWISVHAGASLSLLVVQVGVTIEARLLESYLIPEIRTEIGSWPLKTCVQLRLRTTPLSIRVYLWYRFITIKVDAWIIGIDISITWGSKNTFKEWGWSAKSIERILFTSCKMNIDRTPPVVGKCTAQQVASTKYFIQWHGFHENTRIIAYHVKIGSIEGSGDDYSSWVDTSRTHLVNLPIMHGRDVFVSVMATNEERIDSPLAYCPLFQSRRKGPKIRHVYDGAVEGKDADYQSETSSLGMNFAFKSDFNEIVNLKWGISSVKACTMDESEANVLHVTSLGDSKSIQVSGINLEHGKTYFTRLYALDTVALKAVMCSDGILIDTTRPMPVHFQDGAGKHDAKFLPSLGRVRGKFHPFIDHESPIIKYEWKIVRNISGEDVTDFIDIPVTQQTPLMEGLSLEPGSPYRLVLRGTNAAGLQAVIETNGFIPDNTPPHCEQQAIDVTNETDTIDVDFSRELSNIQAKWKCSDRESGIRSQFVGVGTYPGGDDIQAFEEFGFLSQTTIIDDVSYVQFTNITVLAKVRYHVTIKIINGASLKKTIGTDGILIDMTPPTVASMYIKDGEGGKDKNFSHEHFTFSAHWEQAFTDAESGMAEYHVGLGTKPGLVDIKAFTSVGSQTKVTITGILLLNGQRYFVTVVGCNRVGMCINASSNGAIVDSVPPHTGKVFTGLTGPPTLYQWITNSVWARWNWCLADEKRPSTVLNYSHCNNESFYDVHSGISMFAISVMSQSSNQLLAPFKVAGRQRFTGRNINLQDGIYSLVVEASDKAGVSTRGRSNAFIVDSSPPTITRVQHGHFGERTDITNSSVVTFRSHFVVEDNLSKIKAYKIGVGSYSGADDIIKFQFFSFPLPVTSLRANWTSIKPTSLKNNQQYFISLLAINSAGLFSIKSSPPLLCDYEAPQNGVVLDGWGFQDAVYQSFTSLFRAHWYGFTDFSGIEKVYLGLSSKSKSAVCDVKMEEIVSHGTNFHVLSGLALISGQKYYACLKLVDRAGNSNFFQSNGVVVDTSPPRSGFLTDGRPGQDIDVQIENSVLRASWGNFTDHETKIVTYHLAFGSFPGGQDVQILTNVGMVGTATSSRLKVSELTTGQRYYASVIAYNVLGMPSSMVSSDGVLVDFTPPFFSQPARDGDDASDDISYTSENSLKVTWKCEDPETEISTIKIAFGLQPGYTDIMNFTSLPVPQTSFITNRKLQSGFRYFGSVQCTNKVGLTSVSFSDGIVYDNTPPNPVYVQDGDYQSTNRTLSLIFKFVDAESSIQENRVKVWGPSSNNTLLDVYGSFRFNGNVTSLTLELSKELVSGKKYYVNVTAVNGVGLETTKQSDGFAVDTTPPICSRVWDGKGDYGDDIEYAPSSSKFTISWVCYDSESPVVQYRLSVRDKQTHKYAIPFYTLKARVNASGSAIITGGGRMITKFEEGHSYESGVELVNAVGLKTINWTNGVTIDSTPPIVTHLKLTFHPKRDLLEAEWLVTDKESGLKSVSWGLGRTPETNDIKNLSDVLASISNISVSTVAFPQGSMCFLNIIAINKGGLSGKASSNAIIIDRSAPNPGIVAAYYALPRNYDERRNKVPNSSFVVTWTGFTDPESGIKKTGWATGKDCQKLKQDDGDLYTEIVAHNSVGGFIIENRTLLGNETYFVAIRATNRAGLHRTDCSPGMLVILGKLSAGVVSDGPVTSANDIDFQLDNRAIWAHWSGFKDPVFGISGYHWCIRDLPPNPSGSDSCAWPFMEVHHLKTKASRFHSLTLKHGKKYYVAVKAENTKGDSVISFSDGVVIDRTSPIAKSIRISPSSGKETLFLTSASAPVVTWSIDDPESGISHFIFSVGSSPFQGDLLAGQRLDSLTRSLNLYQVALTLYEGMMFYVTVTGVNMLGLETILTSQQVVVDWTPPKAGEIADGNCTTPMTEVFIHTYYQRDKAMLFAHWSRIHDFESGVVEYEWCIGTSPGTCEVKSMTSAGPNTTTYHSIAPEGGLQYFVTVKATNGAGLKETIYSDGITVDTTPPVIKGVHHGVEEKENDVPQLIIQNDGGYLAFYWEKPYDAESGISSVKWCAGTTNKYCNIVSLTSVDLEQLSVKHHMSESLVSGIVVFITLLVENGAGMITTVVSTPLLIDSTPPSVGNVIVGTTAGTTYFGEGTSIAAKWTGFIDGESHLSHFEWAICQASLKDKCISPYVNVSLKTTTNMGVLGESFGVSYVVVVRAFNKAGLFSEASSNQFILNGAKPSAGTVYDGLERRKDIEFQSSTTRIAANWSPFTDVNSRIADYEICVGTEPGTCDESAFVSLGIKLTGTITGLSLSHNREYFVTIRATSESGYSTTATSNGVRVDSTPAIGGEVRDGQTTEDIDYKSDGRYIYANWDEFQDDESDVTGYTWCAGTGKGICDIISETDVGDRTSAAKEVLPPLPGGISIFVTVCTFNNAGASTTVSSDGFKVDNTPPILSMVLDLQLGLGDKDIDYLTAKDSYCVSWDGMDSESGVLRSEVSVCSELDINDCLLHNVNVGNKTVICMADLEFTQGIKHVTKIRLENNVGLFTEFYSDGFVFDSTPPFVGEIFHMDSWRANFEEASEQITFTHSLIAVQWRSFLDKESGVRNFYICVGTQPGECNSRNYTEVRNSTTYTFQDLTLVHGETYFVSVKAENRAGLTSDVKVSDGILVDTTGPINGGAIQDGTKDGEDINFQQSRTLVLAHWNAFEDLESDIIKVTWCAGLSSGACDLVKITQLGLESTSVLYVLTEPIARGQRYYVTVKATNSAGVITSLTSDGVTVDDTPPISGIVVDGMVSDVDYVNGEDDISARWFDFVDFESGIESYEVALCDARNLSSCPQPSTSVGQVANVTITGLDLESSVQYRVIVTAINYAGLKVEAFSNGFTVDLTPPTEGKVWVGAENGLHILFYQSDPNKVVVSWNPFTDVQSGIAKYEVCLSSVLENCTITTFTDVGLNTSYTISGLHLTHGETFYTIVRGTNRIGMSSEATSDGILIDLTPPTLMDDVVFSDSKGPSTTLQASNRTLQNEIPLITLRCCEQYLTSSWEEFEDHESGILNYDWCVGTAKNLCDVVSMRSMGKKTRGSASFSRLRSGTKFFSTVYAVNGARLRRRITSDPCPVITVAPEPAEVIDISSFNAGNFTDIDWTATLQNLSLSWKYIGLRVQVAVTRLSSDLSVPRLIQKMSWKGEPFERPFIDALSWQRNVTITSATFKPWERYRGIIRVWNEGGIYSEASSDGLKMEPIPPPIRGLTIRDKAAENEHLRWWPTLRIPPVNQSSVNTDIAYFSSPADLELTVHSNPSNATFNKPQFIPKHDMFSRTAEFKILVNRVTGGGNDTLTTSQSRTMKVIPGFAHPDGPCCASQFTRTAFALSDVHFKPTLPSEDFGVSVAVLPNDVVAIGCKGKVVLQSLNNQTASHSITLDDLSNRNARVKLVSYQNKAGFLLNGKLYLYEHTPGSPDSRRVLGTTIVIGKCKNISASHCSENETWADNIGQAFALIEHIIAVTGTNSTTNYSVVGMFRKNAEKWMFAQVVGEEMKDPNFGHAISLNKRVMAIAAGDGKNCCVFIYSIPTLTLRKTIYLNESVSRMAPLSIHLTETDALVVLSKSSGLLKVFQFNTTSNSYHKVCEYNTWRYYENLSGNLDVNTRDEGFIVAIGIETLDGAEGVQLIGFQGIYSTDLHERKETSECVDLGAVLARESGLRADGMGTRTSVSFKGDTILFGIPGFPTWPGSDRWLSTGRVFMATYCPSNHFRTRVSGLQSLRPVSCVPCKQGRKSFGGFVETCSVCAGRICPLAINDFSSFTSGICDNTSCVSTSHLSDTTHGVNVHLANGSLFVGGPEYVYTVTLLETTRAGQTTSSFSESFVIDSTAPVPGVVNDGLGSDQNMNCSDNSTFGENSQCSTRNFQGTDVDFTSNTREIHARWIDFLDNESDVVVYFWCVGRKPMTDDIRVCESTGMRPNGSHYGLSLDHGDSYYVTVIACNGARMCSAAHSDGVTIDTTPPVMKYVRDGVMEPDMDYQVFVDIIFAYFSASDPESGVRSYEVAWGTGAGLIDVADFEEVINITVWRAKLKNGVLEIGKKYYATVRATNGAGLMSDWLSSDGIVVGKSEFVFDNSSTASFLFDTVRVNDNGTRKDGGVGQTYGTLTVPEGAVEDEVKLRCYSLDEMMLNENKTEEGPVSNPSYTRPKQFMLGNYSFQIKALDPQNDTVQEGFRFTKPIKLSMFYDVDNLVKANKEHVNNEVTKDDIDPVLYLWDPRNETWFDAALTCPEPWSHVNRSFKLLEVHVCHLTQFAFFFTFYAQNGLILFDKNHSIFTSDGQIKVSYVENSTKLEIPVRRSKGSQGDITVKWSLFQNDSSDSLDSIWPKSGMVSMVDGQWKDSFTLNVDNGTEAPESVIWVRLENSTGGALLASRDETTAKILLTSSVTDSPSKWIIIAVSVFVASIIVLF